MESSFLFPVYLKGGLAGELRLPIQMTRANFALVQDQVKVALEIVEAVGLCGITPSGHEYFRGEVHDCDDKDCPARRNI
mgnify:CR=1 FL=1